MARGGVSGRSSSSRRGIQSEREELRTAAQDRDGQPEGKTVARRQRAENRTSFVGTEAPCDLAMLTEAGTYVESWRSRQG